MNKVKQDHSLKEEIVSLSEAIAKPLEDVGIVSSNRITPINLEEERDKFFASTNYNPQFIYEPNALPPIIPEFNFLEEKIAESFVPTKVKNYFLGILTDNIKSWQLRQSIGTEDFAQTSHEFFESKAYFVDSKVLSRCLKTDSLSELFLNYTFEDDKTKFHNFQEISNFFQRYVSANYPDLNVQIEISDHVPYVISATSTKIRIGSQVSRSEKDIRRLIVHEIDSHCIQATNAKKYLLPHLRSIKTLNQMILGEGLAVYNEYRTNTLTNWAARNYILRLLAVELASENFRSIFDAMLEHVPPDEAFTIALRVKRGLKDTSKPGGYLKDSVYYSGFRWIETLVSNNSVDYSDLYMCRNSGKESGIIDIPEYAGDDIVYPQWLNNVTSGNDDVDQRS